MARQHESASRVSRRPRRHRLDVTVTDWPRPWPRGDLGDRAENHARLGQLSVQGLALGATPGVILVEELIHLVTLAPRRRPHRPSPVIGDDPGAITITLAGTSGQEGTRGIDDFFFSL